MLKSTKTTQEELLHSQTNVEETPRDNSPLITHEEIEDTPFHITGSTDKGYFIRMGDYRLTEMRDTAEEAKHELKYNNMWNIILRMIGSVIDRYEKENKK